MSTKNAVVTETPKAPKNTEKAAKVDPERAAAKAGGVSLVYYRILRALANGTPHSYKQIHSKTGYYSNLTAAMRPSHRGSLGHLRLVKERIINEDGQKVIVFKITEKGLKAVGK